MIEKQRAKRFVSIGTYNRLTELLYSLEHVKMPKDIAEKKEQLREYIGKLFTYAEIFELHDDHILELAETVVGLYPERDDLNGYVYHILKYLSKQILKHEQTCAEYVKRLGHMAKEKENKPDEYLDLKYKTWTYTEGYYHQRAHMYRLLQSVLNNLIWYDERNMLCKKKKNTGT